MPSFNCKKFDLLAKNMWTKWKAKNSAKFFHLHKNVSFTHCFKIESNPIGLNNKDFLVHFCTFYIREMETKKSWWIKLQQWSYELIGLEIEKSIGKSFFWLPIWIPNLLKLKLVVRIERTLKFLCPPLFEKLSKNDFGLMSGAWNFTPISSFFTSLHIFVHVDTTCGFP